MAGALVLDQFGLLDHHHRVGAARNDAAGGDSRGGAGRDLERRRIAASDHLGVEAEDFRRGVARRRPCRPRAARNRPHWSGRTAAHRPRATTSCASTRVSAAESGTVSAASGERSRCRSKRARASSADTTSRNCSWRAAARTRASSSALASGRALRVSLILQFSFYDSHGHGLT